MNFTAFLAQPSGPDAPSGTTQTPGADPNAAPSGGGGLFGGGASTLIWFIPLIFILFMMRSQSKKQKEVESNIKLGDRVFTRGGAVGKVVKVGDRHFELELAPGVHVAFRKESIEGLDVDPKKEAEKKDADKKDADKKDADKKDAEKAKKDGDKDKKDKPKPSLEPAKDKA